MNAAHQHQAAAARVYGPGAHALREMIEQAADTFAVECAALRSVREVDSALAQVDGLRRHLLLLRTRMSEAAA